MNRWEFIKKIGLATVGLPLLSSFGLPKAYLSVADQEEREKFDFELYKKTNNGETPYKRKNGNVILSFVFEKGEGGYIEERMNVIPYYTVLKEYYSDGSIKLKETYIGQATKTGISEYYDKKGRVTRINEDKKFGRIKPLDVLKFIEKKGYINLKEGKSWFRENGEMKFGFYFTEEKGYKYYSIMVPGKEGEVSIPKRKENLKLIPIYTFLWMARQDKSIRKKSSRIVTNPQKLPVPSKAKPILKKHGKPLSKNQGKYQAKKNHKSF